MYLFTYKCSSILGIVAFMHDADTWVTVMQAGCFFFVEQIHNYFHLRFHQNSLSDSYTCGHNIFSYDFSILLPSSATSATYVFSISGDMLELYNFGQAPHFASFSLILLRYFSIKFIPSTNENIDSCYFSLHTIIIETMCYEKWSKNRQQQK